MSAGNQSIISKRKAEEDDSSPVCYCGSSRKEQFMFVCNECRRWVHIGCLKSEKPSPLLGDIYFKFICENCGPQLCESFTRVNLPWTFVLLISLYNLHVQASSNCGYFKWRTQICSFIEKHWNVFFGSSRKKSSTWPGTVAGTLSANSTQLFKSGTQELGQLGWWALASPTLPSLDDLLETHHKTKERGRKRTSEMVLPPEETIGRRHRTTKSCIQAAIELKEKRSHLLEAKEIRQNKVLASAEGKVIKTEPSEEHAASMEAQSSHQFDLGFQHLPQNVKDEHQKTHPHDLDFQHLLQNIKQEKEDTIEEYMEEFVIASPPRTEASVSEVMHDYSLTDILCSDPPEKLIEEEPTDWSIPIKDIEDDVLDDQAIALNIDIESDTGHFLQEQTLETADLMNFSITGLVNENENCEVHSDSSSSSDSVKICRDVQQKMRRKKEKPFLSETEKPNYIFMTEYDEHQLLKRLEKLSSVVKNNPAARRLQRKLHVRERQREENKPLFDLDEQFRTLTGLTFQEPSMSTKSTRSSDCPLDRYQLVSASAQGRTHRSFVTRLMGFEDEHLESVISPYTRRTLKPFIFRDYETTPLKLNLLHEIQHYHQRSDPEWEKPVSYPLDFCYVRPNHIPVINSLCQDFFWPGIELSECLQYPDFSCVVLYRKVIVGFAFMVPDVKYNEVYIPFIFTHPEWRNAGIATFMIYHLIQTCMGKDVTLHVSVTNPALFLYQKFGFKVEELILDFYDKYLPVQSKECRHALFLRLSR